MICSEVSGILKDNEVKASVSRKGDYIVVTVDKRLEYLKAEAVIENELSRYLVQTRVKQSPGSGASRQVFI